MSFLLDTNTCSAHFRRPSGLAHRFMQHSRKRQADLGSWLAERHGVRSLQTPNLRTAGFGCQTDQTRARSPAVAPQQRFDGVERVGLVGRFVGPPTGHPWKADRHA